MKNDQLVLTEQKGKVGLITLNRPEAYNALNQQLLSALMDSLAEYDKQDHIGAMIITGNQKSFAAGADITDMANASPDDMRESSFIPSFSRIQDIKKPVLAAVSGYCLGGGIELAMSCDMIIASETAKFSQPEINLGIIPGAGGTQRLTRAVGKNLAMEMILNNRSLSAQEALNLSLVNYVYPVEEYLSQALSLAQQIAERAPQAVQAAKKAINHSFEVGLSAGLAEERDLFINLFLTQDQKEGMNAFLEKRSPKWTGK